MPRKPNQHNKPASSKASAPKSSKRQTSKQKPESKAKPEAGAGVVTIEKRGKGRPAKYSKEFVDEICEMISTCPKGLHFVCNQLKVGFSTVFEWLNDPDKKYFADRYARAKEAQAEYLNELLTDIANDDKNDTLYGEMGPYENKEWVNRSKLKADVLKWQLSKLLPKKFGDKVDVTTGGDKLPANNSIDLSKATVSDLLKLSGDNSAADKDRG